MSPSESEFLIHLTGGVGGGGENLEIKDTTYRKAISVQESLALTLRL